MTSSFYRNIAIPFKGIFLFIYNTFIYNEFTVNTTTENACNAKKLQS